MIKKTTHVGIAITIAALVLCGCGKKEASKEIEFLTNRTDYVQGTADAAGNFDESTAYYKILAKKFKEETGITVKLTAYNDYQNAMRRRLASSDPGDVITLPDTSFTQKNIKTFFQPIGTKEQLSDFRFLDNCAIGDNVYGLSASYYLTGAIYNKKVFAEAGYKKFPENLTELHDAFAKIKANGKIPVITNRGQRWPLGQLRMLVTCFAGSPDVYNKLWSVDNPFAKDKPMGVLYNELALWVTKGWVEHEFIADWEGSKTKLASGDAGVMFLGSWAYPQVKDRTESCPGAKAEDIGFAAFPICNPYQTKQYIEAGAGNPMVISKKTKNFEACKKWIDFIISSGMEKSQGGIPIKKSMKEYDPGFDSVMNKITEDSIILFNSPAPNAFNGERTPIVLKDMDMFADYKYIGKPLDEARKSMKDYQECIDNMNKQFNQIRKDRGY